MYYSYIYIVFHQVTEVDTRSYSFIAGSTLEQCSANNRYKSYDKSAINCCIQSVNISDVQINNRSYYIATIKRVNAK